MLVCIDNYQACSIRLARASSLLFFYGVIASMALANIGMALTLFFWLMSGVWLQKSPAVISSPIAPPIVGLVLMTAISLIYTVAPMEYVGRYFLVYGKWLFVLVLINIHTNINWLRFIFMSIALAVSVVLFSTYINVFFHLPWANSAGGFGVDNSIFYDYIAQGVMTCCVSVIALGMAFKSEERIVRWIAGLLFALLTFSIFFLLTSRTAQLAIVVAVFVMSIFIFSKRQFLIFSVMAVLALITFLELSPVLLNKIQLIAKESMGYFQQNTELTSVGARISMWKNSMNFIAEAPWIGHGVGSYRYLSEMVYLDPVMCAISCTHPHNQPIFLMVEYGLIGMLIYVIFVNAFVHVIREWWLINPLVSIVVLGVLAIFLVDSLINSPLWISSLRNFYVAACALIFIHYSLMRKSSEI